MTEMETKLKAAGVKVKPLRQRIWEHIEVSNGCTASQVHKEFGGTMQRMNSLLSTLKKMGLVYSEQLYGTAGKKLSLVYYTVGDTYKPGGVPKAPCAKDLPIVLTSSKKELAPIIVHLQGLTLGDLILARDYLNGVLK